VNLRVSRPLFADLYNRNPHTGGFILIDEVSNATVGAGMILAASSSGE
jgi:bifunctional enzyme CysN/CysC/sulfate adenylyltransferase subunit 1